VKPGYCFLWGATGFFFTDNICWTQWSFWMHFCKHFRSCIPHNIRHWKMHERFTRAREMPKCWWILPSFTWDTHASHYFLSNSQIINLLYLPTTSFLFCICTIRVVLNTSASEKLLSHYFWGRNDNVFFLILRGVWAFLKLSFCIIIWVLWSSTV
jgi:hypothetical protein